MRKFFEYRGLSREIKQQKVIVMANKNERIGVYHCAEIAERNNWMFREQPVDDIGIDAHMEFVDESGKPKQLLALQIKSGASWFKEKKDGNIFFAVLAKDNIIIGLRIPEIATVSPISNLFRESNYVDPQYASHHIRNTDKNEITLHHLFFDFTGGARS